MARFCKSWAAISISQGPTPVPQALAWLEQAREDSQTPDLWFDPWRAGLLSLIGRFDDARVLQSSTIERMADRGMQLGVVCASENAWRIEMNAGEFAMAEQAARRACTLLEEMGERAFWSTGAGELAQALYCQGRYDEAESWARRGGEAGASDDALTQLLSRQVLAKVEARRGHFDDAHRLAAEAVAIAEPMQAPWEQGVAMLDVAEVLWLAGDREGAIARAELATSYFEIKGATVGLERARQFHETVEGSSSS